MHVIDRIEYDLFITELMEYIPRQACGQLERAVIYDLTEMERDLQYYDVELLKVMLFMDYTKLAMSTDEKAYFQHNDDKHTIIEFTKDDDKTKILYYSHM
jgi:hypothetical protein